MSNRRLPTLLLQRSLIREVQKRRELWDYNHERYNNKMVLLQAWDDISKIFDTSSRKVEMEWRRLRDVYRRELLQHVKTGKPSTWFHFENLSWLQNNYHHSLQANTVESTDDKSDDPDDSELKIIKTESLNPHGEQSLKNEQSLPELEPKRLSEEELKNFLLSLLPEIEPMNNKQMREFKKQVSSLVQSILD